MNLQKSAGTSTRTGGVTKDAIALPKLIRTSDLERGKRVMNPEDTGLNLIVNGIFTDVRLSGDDIITVGGVRELARRTVYNLETDPPTIVGRQRVLNAFINNLELVSHTRNWPEIPNPPTDSAISRYHFEDRDSWVRRKQRGTLMGFVDYV